MKTGLRRRHIYGGTRAKLTAATLAAAALLGTAASALASSYGLTDIVMDDNGNLTNLGHWGDDR